MSTSQLQNNISSHHEFSQRFRKRGNVRNKILQVRNWSMAQTNGRLSRKVQKTSKNHRFPLVPDQAKIPLIPYYFLCPRINLLKANQEVTRTSKGFSFAGRPTAFLDAPLAFLEHSRGFLDARGASLVAFGEPGPRDARARERARERARCHQPFWVLNATCPRRLRLLISKPYP